MATTFQTQLLPPLGKCAFAPLNGYQIELKHDKSIYESNVVRAGKKWKVYMHTVEQESARKYVSTSINIQRAYYIRLVNATNVAKQAAMMIIDQTSSPLSRTRPFQFNGDRSVLRPSFIANIMWKLKISSIGIMRHSGMTRYASVSFSLLFFFTRILCCLPCRSFATIFASAVIVIILFLLFLLLLLFLCAFMASFRFD